MLRRAGAGEAPQGFAGRGIGGEERLQRQLRQGDVERRAEHRRGAEEREHARVGGELQRHQHARILALGRPAATCAPPARDRPPSSAQQLGQHRIGGDLDLAAQAREQVRAPFRRVGDARRQALGVQAQAQHVDRRPQQRGIGAAISRRHRAVGAQPASSGGRPPAPDRARAPPAPGRRPCARPAGPGPPAAARRNTGANPAATSSTLRSRRGISSCSARCSTMSREGCERPVSRKLRCRVEISASEARSSWLMRRRWRHSRNRSPTGCAVCHHVSDHSTARASLPLPRR